MNPIAIAADLLGWSTIKTAIVTAVLAALLGLAAVFFFSYREEQRQIGWDRALQGVEKTNDSAVAGAHALQATADACYRDGGVWSVITRDCTKEAAK